MDFQAALVCTKGASTPSAAEAFFDLANATHVRFPVSRGATVTIRQDPENQTTGGCVWETSYLLALWTLRTLEPRLSNRGRTDNGPVRCLEVGAGCGLLGIALASAGASVIVTECAAAMANLEWNVARNPPPPATHGALSARTLDWTDHAHARGARAEGPFSFLLGTDCVYVRCTWRIRPKALGPARAPHAQTRHRHKAHADPYIRTSIIGQMHTHTRTSTRTWICSYTSCPCPCPCACGMPVHHAHGMHSTCTHAHACCACHCACACNGCAGRVDGGASAANPLAVRQLVDSLLALRPGALP